MKQEAPMRCPYCKQIFLVTQDQLDWDETFECPHCHLSNAGCCEADELGVLIGISIVDEQLRDIQRRLK